MPNEFEEQYLDVLQNLEFSLASVYRKNAAMTDWDALKALDALIRTFQAEASGREATALRLNDAAQDAFDATYAMCEMRLGRGTLKDKLNNQIDTTPRSVTVPEIVACLKRIKRSVEKWQKEGGRRGYYEFIRQFLGM